MVSILYGFAAQQFGKIDFLVCISLIPPANHPQYYGVPSSILVVQVS